MVIVPAALLGLALGVMPTGQAPPHVLAFWRAMLLWLIGMLVVVAILSGDPRRYRVLATIQLGTLFAMSLVSVAMIGPLPGVIALLASTVVLAALLFGSRAAWASIAVTTLFLLAVGGATHVGLRRYPDPGVTLDWTRMDTWVRMSVGYFSATTVVATAASALLRRLERAVLAERKAREAAERALSVREEFLAIASHELRTPITSLRLSLQGVLRRAKDGSLGEGEQRPSTERMIEIAARQAGSLSSLVDTLLDVSGIESGLLDFVLSDFDLADAVTTSIAQLRDPLRESGSQLTVDVSAPIVGRWDRSRVEQVVTSLLSNAIKYGEGKPIEIRGHAEDGIARLVIQDHGMGIAPEAQGRIFGRFERAVSSRHYGGFGLGLYVVQFIVQRLGGALECESRLHEGSVFTVTLPRVPPPPSAAPPLAVDNRWPSWERRRNHAF